MVREEIKKNIKDFLEFNENEGTEYPNFWDTMQAVLKRKFISLGVFKRKLERFYTITVHLEALEKMKH